jgi:uncharacterized cupin superfamily protein
MPTPNVFSAEFEYDGPDPEGYRAGQANLGRLAGGAQTAIKANELPPGQSICPYH